MLLLPCCFFDKSAGMLVARSVAILFFLSTRCFFRSPLGFSIEPVANGVEAVADRCVYRVIQQASKSVYAWATPPVSLLAKISRLKQSSAVVCSA
jgi:hypothetical protein